MKAATASRALTALAEAYGIVPGYVDLEGHRRTASPEALYAALRALGAPVAGPGDLEDALWEREERKHLRLVEPVSVSWEGTAPAVEVRPGRAERAHRIDCRLTVSGGETREWTDAAPRIELPPDLPVGYHDLEISIGGRTATTRVIRAPRATWDPEKRAWGTFLPLWALRSRGDWGTGDFGSLGDLLDWTASIGGDVVGTLPLYAAFLSTPFDPSPYAPASRLFWNEAYVDPTAAPELADAPTARERIDSDPFRRRLRALHRAAEVDWREVASVKRVVLEDLSRAFFAGEGWRSDDFHAFLARRPEAREYARFRAAGELWERPWRQWPQRMREGELAEGDFAEEAARYHLYAQWLADRQVGALAGRDAGLYLDLPLGVHADGFDVWRHPDLYVDGVAAGAPPDDFFRGGQDWGFPPLHPEAIREDGHRHFAAILETVCRAADVVRIDHVMGLHRVFWVPEGMDAVDGVYVRYPAEEMWAVVCVESHRSRAAIVGEDLGTVPPEVRREMEERGARRTYVLPFHVRDEPPRIEPPPERSAALLDTHDTPPFAAWWEALAPHERRTVVAALEAGGSPIEADPGEMPESERARPVLESALRWLSDSEARLVLVNLEDLWLETEPQNVPGTTTDERPNWRRRARFPIEILREMPEVVEPLRAVDARRGETEREGSSRRGDAGRGEA